MRWATGFFLVAVGFLPAAFGFVEVCVLPTNAPKRMTTVALAVAASDKNNNENTTLLLEELRSMRVKELKAELDQWRISTADAFEKEELVQRLYRVRLANPKGPTTPKATPKATPKTRSSDAMICGDMFFTAVETGRSIQGNMHDQTSVTIKAEGNPYPTIVLDVASQEDSPNTRFGLTLLLDTACSGVVLRPSTCQKHPETLPTVASPVTMTGAGGSASGTGVTQIRSFAFGSSSSMGPLVAAVQDIGALPLELDGIIGLSFLSQYACSEFDLDHSKLVLYKDDYRPELLEYDDQSILPSVVAEAELSPTSLGIWTVDVSFCVGGKPLTPVKMLVDTGATSSFLSWKGLNSMGLDRSSPEVSELRESMGAMGSDNVAMSLTHRIELDAHQPIRFGRRRGSGDHNGLLTRSTIPIDIGNIAILDTQLAADNVAGILGMDVLSEASRLRMVVRGPIPRITLYQTETASGTTKAATETVPPKQEDTASEPTKASAETEEPPAPVEVEEIADVPPSPTEEAPRKKKKKKRRYE